MTPDNQMKLVKAYRLAAQAKQDEIADLLACVIVGEMEPEGPATYLDGHYTVRDGIAISPALNQDTAPAYGSRHRVTCVGVGPLPEEVGE